MGIGVVLVSEMKFLLPIGGITDSRFGILTTPATRGIPAGIVAGLPWAADNQAFTKLFDPAIFFPWLEKLNPYKNNCLFVACPDTVGHASKTLEKFDLHRPYFGDWPVAFVAQDGQEDLDFPHPALWDALFIGGSTSWKMSDAAIDCIQRAQKMGKHIHIGRINYHRRYRHFRSLPGSEEFTCDGTRTRFEKTAALRDWSRYMATPKQYNLFVSISNHSGKSAGD